jgi:peptidoglycan/xylan/chitin deacetylase (PgdA/CDA1 family)
VSPAARVAAASGALAAGVAWCGPGLAVHWPLIAQALGVPLTIPRLDGVALTYDDGPHPEGTPAALEALRAGRAKATFFLVGEQVRAYPTLVEEIVSEGHAPAVHAYRHRNQMRLTPAAFEADLDRAVEEIGEVCGRGPTYYRPPYGVFTLTGLAAVRRRGLEPLLWSRWGKDWPSGQAPEQIASRATRGLSRGDVILLHDADSYSSPGSHRATAAATPLILGELGRQGLRPAIP